MLSAEHALSHFQQLAVDRLGLDVSALVREGASQVVCSRKGFWTLCPEQALSRSKLPAGDLLGLGVSAMAKE